jgi:hypothetical protein
MKSVSFMKYYITEMIIQIALMSLVYKTCKRRHLMWGKSKILQAKNHGMR